MGLDTLQHILAPAASLALIAGVIIATLQFRNQQHLRELEIVMRLYATFGEEHFVFFENMGLLLDEMAKRIARLK